MTRAVEPIFWTNRPASRPVELTVREDQQAEPLDSLGLRFRSDKSSLHHGFLGFYERFLSEIRHSAMSVLEIGVNGGESLRMWEGYFPSARIFGLDHRPECLAVTGSRIQVTILEAADVIAWGEFAAKHGPFDLIVDDGTHFWEHQIAAFRTFFGAVRPGGYYILEDIDTSYGDYVDVFRGVARHSAAAYLQTLGDLVVGAAPPGGELIDDAFLKSAATRVEFLAYARRTALLRRKPA